jgi:hypothetical protein
MPPGTRILTGGRTAIRRPNFGAICEPDVPPPGFKYPHRNGLLGHWRASKIYGSLDEELPPTSDDNGNRVGSLSGRSSANF